MDRASVVDRLRACFASSGEGVVCAHLFGSTARGTSGERSDIDVASHIVSGERLGEPETSRLDDLLDFAEAARARMH